MHVPAINAFCRRLKAEGHMDQAVTVKQVPCPTTPIPLFTAKDIQVMPSKHAALSSTGSPCSLPRSLIPASASTKR